MLNNKSTYNFSLFFLALSPLLVWCFWQLNRDLWYDESYTLQYFTLVSWKETYANYPMPNNHVFHNLILQCFTRITGLRTTNQIVDNIYFLRGLHALITGFVILYSWKFSKLFTFKINANLLIVILLTTIPFLNFSLQIRGYMLSTLLLLMLIYYTLFYLKSGVKSLWVPVLVALLFYTIPSNLYFILAAGIGLIYCLYKGWKDKDLILRHRVVTLIVLYLVGLIIGLSLYYPVLENVFFNDFSSKSSPSIFYIVELFWDLLLSIISSRYFLLLFILPGIWIFVRQSFSMDRMIVVFLFIVFFGGFLIALIHQKKPFDRTFVPLIPLFVIGVSVFVHSTLLKITNEKWKNFTLFLIVVISILTFLWENQRNNDFIRTQLLNEEVIMQTCHSNYFLVEEHNLSKNFNYLAQNYDCPVLQFKLIDFPSIYFYNARYGVKTQHVGTMDEVLEILKKEDKIVIITTFLKSTLEKVRELDGVRYSLPNKNQGVLNIIEIVKE